MKLTVNEQPAELPDVAPDTPLLYILRNDLRLNGPKFGCGLGECGACSVLIDGKVARSCSVPVGAVRDARITTLEGLAPQATVAAKSRLSNDVQIRLLGTSALELAGAAPVPPPAADGTRISPGADAPSAATQRLHPVQQAFIEEQAAQCGYCTNGMIMALVALFDKLPTASDAQVKTALQGNLCRCGTHVEIMRAAARARELIAQGAR